LLFYHPAYIIHVLPSCYISSVCPIKTDIERGASFDTPLKFMFSLSFKPPSAELAHITILSKGEFAAAHSRLVGKT